ncbi:MULTISPECIES: hypothetical protein [Burkholderia cepacia complex]|nr:MULTISPECIES: hypothetical protein [Burkholderia cepacia complex]MDW9232991.1 hypothetical protein [Burkholderia cepacia]
MIEQERFTQQTHIFVRLVRHAHESNQPPDAREGFAVPPEAEGRCFA